MATVARVTPTGFVQYDDGASFARVTPTGFLQFEAAAPPAGGTTNPFSMGAVNLLQGKVA